MKKANAPDAQEAKPGLVEVSPEAVDRIRPYLQFPVNSEARQKYERLRQYQSNIENYERNIEQYKQGIAQYRADIKASGLQMAKLNEVQDAEPFSNEQAQQELIRIGRLPWVLNVRLEYPMLVIRTREGMLKTKFETRVIDCGGGVSKQEYLAEPVITEMPQYEIGFNLLHLGNPNWANNTGALRIRLVNKKDVSKFIGGKVCVQEPHPHWASSGRGRFAARTGGDWEHLCLGEYEEDLAAASKEGAVPFLSSLAQYLQTAGYEHAYRRKDEWALWLGKPEYNEFIFRAIEPGESLEQIDERYKRDYKLLNQVDIPEGVPGGTFVGEVVYDGTTTAPGGLVTFADGRWRALEDADAHFVDTAALMNQMLRTGLGEGVVNHLALCGGAEDCELNDEDECGCWCH